MSNIFNKVKSKIRDATDDLQADLESLKVTVKTTYNPNHRHDEADEKAVDAKRTAICDSHRFGSFAPERQQGLAKWYIDGHDYFWALSEILQEAKETIFILDWWLSPEIYLRRPPSKHEDWRLDRLLQRKAEQGVQICIMVYKEVTQTMSMSSGHTKHFLENLHPNIAVMRHPDHIGGGGESVLYFSHHEKVVIVDNSVACIGGLDICYGRWDTHNSPLVDADPEDLSRQLFPGQDYNNARVADFSQIDRWLSSQADRLSASRMPWHDVHTMLRGPAVRDISQHFAERWNFVRGLKYRHDSRFHVLAFPHDLGDSEGNEIQQHPHFHQFSEGMHFHIHRQHPPEGPRHGGTKPTPPGVHNIQVLRSSADWSHGILTEHSIQNAYIQIIREAKDFVYIENQFFVTSTGKGNNREVENLIGQAIVERVLSAARAGENFRVFILCPAIPGFSGDMKGAESILTILSFTYASISRGEKSIFGMIKSAGFDPTKYIFCYNLRSFDRLPSPEIIRRKQDATGLSYEQIQACVARIHLGDHPGETEAKNAQDMVILKTAKGESLDQKKTKSEAGPGVHVQIPPTVQEALQIIHRWESSSPDTRSSASISHTTLQAGRNLLDDAWHGNDQDHKQAFVTEEKYIHSKLLIADDRVVLIGSANLNDRSQVGDHDSEIAIVIEDTETVEATINGRRSLRPRFATEFRRQLFKLHLGLVEPQTCPPEHDVVTDGMRQLGEPQSTDSKFDHLVEDPLSDDFIRLWESTAASNSEHYENVFHCVPSNRVTNWQEYDQYITKSPQQVGHIYDTNMDLGYIKNELSQIRGCLVSMPLLFLEQENLAKLSFGVNSATMALYI